MDDRLADKTVNCADDWVTDELMRQDKEGHSAGHLDDNAAKVQPSILF